MTVEIDFRKIRPLHGDRKYGFEEFCCQLAKLEIREKFPDQFIEACFNRKDGKGGDAGVECYYVFSDGGEWGWQAKYFVEGLGDVQWRDIDDSVRTALEKHPRLLKYTICLPINLSDARVPRRRSQKDRWNQRVEKWTSWAAELGLKVDFDKWEDSALRQRLVESADKKAGFILYWFNEKIFTQDWFDQRLAEAVHDAGPRYTAELHPELHVELPIAKVFDALGKTDPFVKRFHDFYTDMYRKWNRATPGEGLNQMLPELAGSIDGLRAKVENLGKILKRCEAERFEPIDLESLRGVAKDLSESLESCIEITQKDDRQQLVEPQRTVSVSHNLTAGEQASVARDALRRLDSVAADMIEFTYEESARISNLSFVLVVGEAGTGKTHLFCDVAKHRVNIGLPTVLLLGEKFTTEKGSWGQIADQLFLNDLGPEELLGALDAAAQVRGLRALIMIDALNEGQGVDLWKKYLGGMAETAKKYPHIAFALSCRDTYQMVVIPPDMIENGQIYTVRHRGFEGHEFDATRKFFDYFGIESPTGPLLVPEFSNPLFLKLLCSGLQNQGLRRIPKGFRGITKVFDFFIESTNIKLASELGFDPDDRYVQVTANRLAQAMAEKSQAWLETTEAKHIIEQIRSEPAQYEKTLYRNLIHEGMLKEDLRLITRDSQKENERLRVVSFAYERLANHLIVSHWLQSGFDPENPIDSLMSIEPLRPLLTDKSFAQRHAGWVSAFSIQLPERAGREVMELFPAVKSWDSFQRALLESLFWRSPEKTGSATRELLNELWKEERFIPSIYDVLLMSSCEPEHSLNASYLHEHLSKFTMPERDATWSIYLHDRYSDDDHGPMYRLIEWAWQADKTNTEDRVIELCSVTLSWFLVSSNRFLRDRATKALVSMLRKRPRILLKVIDYFRNADDLYAIERLFAVAYGTVMLCEDTEVIQDIAAVTHRFIFANERPPAHLLLRDYARGVIETAVYKNVAPPNLAFRTILPSYKSSWPLEAPDLNQLERYKEWPEKKSDPAWSRVWLYHSIIGHSEFTRYVINHGCDQFCERTLIAAEDHSADESSKTVARFGDDHFSHGLAQNWIINRVFDLGWTVKRFGAFDKRISQMRSLHETHQPEPFGRKYAWIAVHELLARLSDNLEYCDHCWGIEPEEYCGPWQLHRRDIDPACLIKETCRTGLGKGKKTWWQPIDYSFDERDQGEFEAWAKDFRDLPDPSEMMEVEDSEGRRWLVLESSFYKVEEPPPEEDEFKVLRRSVRLWVSGYLVQADRVKALVKWLKRQDFSDLPEAENISEVFLGEYPWAASFKQYDSTDPWACENYLNPPYPMMITAAWYTWERGYDCSIDDSIQGFLPSAWLVRMMGLRWSGEGFVFINRDGAKVAFDPSAQEIGPAALLISKDCMEAFLAENNLALICAACADRTVAGHSGYSWKTILQGVYRYEKGKIIGGPFKVRL